MRMNPGKRFIKHALGLHPQGCWLPAARIAQKEAAVPPQATQEVQELRFYNWGTYIDPAILKTEEEYGLKSSMRYTRAMMR
jgi:spermidine/putrescine-binding protein